MASKNGTASSQAPKRINVVAQPDFLRSLTQAIAPVFALEELIWNALDADARKINIVTTPGILGELSEIRIVDDGHGISIADAEDAFGNLGASQKRHKKTTPAGRLVHGAKGKGRFKAYSLGHLVEWTSVSGDRGRRKRIEIVGDANQVEVFQIRQLACDRNEAPGTTVTVRNIVPELSAAKISSGSVRDQLAGKFAPYLKRYPNAQIILDGEEIRPETAIETQVEVDISDRLPPSTTGAVEIVFWRRKVERWIYLCDRSGISLGQIRYPELRARGVYITAYLKSDLVRSQSENGQIDLSDFDDEMRRLIDEAKVAVKDSVTKHLARSSGGLVAEWKEAGIYPYRAEPASEVERREMQVFDIVATEAADFIPSFQASDRKLKQLTLEMLRVAVSQGTPELHRILRDVIGLPAPRQKAMFDLLEKTSLDSMISAAQLVTDRLEILAGLKHLLFDPSGKRLTKERSQLHRLVAEHTWLFGEKYNLMASDQSLTNVLKGFLQGQGIGVLEEEVLLPDGRKGVIDLAFARIGGAPTNRRHLVVELKRPNVRIGIAEMAQTQGYAHALANQDRYRQTGLRWDFWAVSNEIDESVIQPSGDGGLYMATSVYRVYARTWSQIISEAEERLQFISEKLNYRATDGAGWKALQEKHATLLPAIAAPAATAA